ncbi:MAG: class I SAM-dependent methyltransferase [Candidatus Electrothrix sp. GW3-4]|uniref:class I SAM-dependent methyltransferase n=1 Tax=Candidatus Electrothrix sp. GW3-4 TaxID=3126740 RepID=UPI0030CD7A64
MGVLVLGAIKKGAAKMERIAEPELMEGEEQGLVYAQADFSEANRLFLSLFTEKFSCFSGKGEILDLGCGPADILIRFARAYPDCTFVGLDGAETMLAPGRCAVAQEQLEHRIALHCQHLPCSFLPDGQRQFQAILANSFLHHLHRPEVLWQTIREYTAPGGAVLVMDLFRPESIEAARYLVSRYAADEPETLQEDFYNSLLAAFRPEEIQAQLKQAGLEFCCEKVSDRHIAVWGSRTW